MDSDDMRDVGYGKPETVAILQILNGGCQPSWNRTGPPRCRQRECPDQLETQALETELRPIPGTETADRPSEHQLLGRAQVPRLIRQHQRPKHVWSIRIQRDREEASASALEMVTVRHAARIVDKHGFITGKTAGGRHICSSSHENEVEVCVRVEGHRVGWAFGKAVGYLHTLYRAASAGTAEELSMREMQVATHGQ